MSTGTEDRQAKSGVDRIISALPLILALCAAAPATAADIDPEAETVLRAMSDYLAEQRTFRLVADASTEILLEDGRKIQLTATSHTLVDRDKGIKVDRQGPAGVTQLVFDGSTVSIFSEREGVYLAIPATGGIDGALDEVRAVLGTEAAGGADLLYSNPYDGLMFEAQSGEYLGKAWVNGVLADHLSYRASEVDWQIWVRSGDQPIPVKYVITSKWMAAAPEFSLSVSGFESAIETKSEDFTFVPPEGAREITADQLPEIDLLTEE